MKTTKNHENVSALTPSQRKALAALLEDYLGGIDLSTIAARFPHVEKLGLAAFSDEALLAMARTYEASCRAAEREMSHEERAERGTLQGTGKLITWNAAFPALA